MDGDAQARARIMEHWRASEQGDSAAEHAIYAADVIPGTSRRHPSSHPGTRPG
jgi:hypothetical protein